MPKKCANDGTVIIAYLEDGAVRGAAELHPPEQSPDSQPEIAFSVETSVRRHGVGSTLFRNLIEEARTKGYLSLRITTGAENEAMRALAHKFGARSDIPPWQIHRQHRAGAATSAGAGIAGDAKHGRRRTRDDEFQSRVLADVLRMYGWGRAA